MKINNNLSDGNLMSAEEKNDQLKDDNVKQAPLSTEPNDDEESRKGLTFNWFNLFLGVVIFIWLSTGSNVFTNDYSFYLYLAIVVVIHELGHVIVGRSFGCIIKEMQVFFLSFVSYKPEQYSEGNSWRNIKWSLGVLPLGGVTMFKSRGAVDKNDEESSYMERLVKEPKSASPYIEDKPACQRLLISAAGVLFNMATFLILYIALPYVSNACYDFFRPLAVLSLLIAVLNILPVYPLDGGAIVFALYEMITNKKPSPGFTRACAWIGFVFIVLFFWVFPEWLDGILDNVFALFF